MREETTKAVERAFLDVGLYLGMPDERWKIRTDFIYLRRRREAVDGGLVTIMWFKLHVLRQP